MEIKNKHPHEEALDEPHSKRFCGGSQNEKQAAVSQPQMNNVVVWPGPNRAGLGAPKYEDIWIPGSMVGLVIGKVGSTIKQLHKRTGAHIRIIQDGPKEKALAKRLRISGNPEQIEQAKQLVLNLIEDKDCSQQSNNCGGGGAQSSDSNQGWDQGQPSQMVGQAVQMAQGKLDYSQDWIEYYRSIGMVQDVAEAQVKAMQMQIQATTGQLPGHAVPSTSAAIAAASKPYYLLIENPPVGMTQVNETAAAAQPGEQAYRFSANSKAGQGEETKEEMDQLTYWVILGLKSETKFTHITSKLLSILPEIRKIEFCMDKKTLNFKNFCFFSLRGKVSDRNLNMITAFINPLSRNGLGQVKPATKKKISLFANKEFKRYAIYGIEDENSITIVAASLLFVEGIFDIEYEIDTNTNKFSGRCLIQVNGAIEKDAMKAMLIWLQPLGRGNVGFAEL